MASVTLAIDEEVKERLSKFLYINLSELAREEVVKKEEMLRKVKEFEEIISKSKLTEEDALRLGRKVSEALAKRYKLSKKAK